MKSITDTLRVVHKATRAFEREHQAAVRLALIGGHAVIFHGVERTTLDVDMLFFSTITDFGGQLYKHLSTALPKRFSATHMRASLDPEDPLKHDLILIEDSKDEYPRVDLLALRYQWELEGMELATDIPDLGVALMPAAYLIAMKLLAGGRKDDLDVLELMSVMPPAEIDLAARLAKRVRRERKFNSLRSEIGKQSVSDPRPLR